MVGNIFITGGTGSIGQAFLARAKCERWDCRFTIFSRDEVKQGDLKSKYPFHKYILGDIRDLDWLTVAMRGHDKVIHAAAYKQVPAAEVNSNQAASVNIIGSLNVIKAAVANSVLQVIGISTDKSCAPVNCYGATKMVMEKLFQEANEWNSDTQFNLVRYGNVLGSRGSVVPLFQKQCAQQNFVTVTDLNMTRFWMTLDNAVDLICKAFDEEFSGIVLIPKCKASTMNALAWAVAPNTLIKVIGLRPGEKIHEQLVNKSESMHTIEDATHFRIFPAFNSVLSNLPEGFEYTSDKAEQLSVEDLRRMINESPYIRV